MAEVMLEVNLQHTAVIAGMSAAQIPGLVVVHLQHTAVIVGLYHQLQNPHSSCQC